jgi:hypothetical protein
MAWGNAFATLEYLEHPVPLVPGRKLIVVAVTSDAPKGLRRYWLALGKSANAK